MDPENRKHLWEFLPAALALLALLFILYATGGTIDL